MSNATSPAAPDHAAEYTRADNAIRSLNTALAYQRDAIEALGALSDADAIELRSDMELSVHRLAGLVRRETARRDAAELAQRDAAE